MLKARGSVALHCQCLCWLETKTPYFSLLNCSTLVILHQCMFTPQSNFFRKTCHWFTLLNVYSQHKGDLTPTQIRKWPFCQQNQTPVAEKVPVRVFCVTYDLCCGFSLSFWHDVLRPTRSQKRTPSHGSTSWNPWRIMFLQLTVSSYAHWSFQCLPMGTAQRCSLFLYQWSCCNHDIQKDMKRKIKKKPRKLKQANQTHWRGVCEEEPESAHWWSHRSIHISPMRKQNPTEQLFSKFSRSLSLELYP